MEGSILIYGGNKSEREGKVDVLLKKVHSTEIRVVESLEGKKSIGIEQTRDLIKFLQKAPVTGKYKAGVIKSAEKMTTEAQNSLLKTLEEPPSNTFIILEAKTHDSMLPTVISRCQKVFAGSQKGRGDERGRGEEEIFDVKLMEKIKNMTLEEKFGWAQEMAKEEREDIIQLLENWVLAERENLTSDPHSVRNIKYITSIKEDLEKTNVNTRLALDTLALNLK